MKISEMSFEQMIDTLGDCTVYFGDIINDEEVMKVCKDFSENKIMLGTAVIKVVNRCLKEHKEDMCSIMAIINEKSIEEVKQENGLKLILEAKNIFADKAFLDFLSQLRN